MTKALSRKTTNESAQNLFSAEDLTAIETVAKRYAVRLTPRVMSAMKGPIESDPIAKQYVPQLAELKILPLENPDPIGDDLHTPVKGIVHRYPDRVLFKPVSVCAAYCRFCFRREKIGPGKEALKPAEHSTALDYIRKHESIWEVIITGGDPLVLAPRQLGELLDKIEAIPHVQVIRVHTRVPSSDPARITPELCAALNRSKALYLSVHINHAQEITPEVKEALAMLHKAGCVLVSQSVLLKGVNDTPEALEDLFRALVALRVKPYYLHHGDRAPGTSHFRTTLRKGQELMKALQGRLSGLCLPHYMLDIPGGHGKIPVQPTWLNETENGYNAEDYQGAQHFYPAEPEE